MRITHVGGPTALIELDGWRLLTDPTFDAPARGTPSAGARRRAATARRSAAASRSTSLLRLGGVRFPVTGPARYTMTAQDAVELCRSLRPRIAIPVHYEGLREDRATAERELAAAPQEVRWLPIGEPVEL